MGFIGAGLQALVARGVGGLGGGGRHGFKGVVLDHAAADDDAGCRRRGQRRAAVEFFQDLGALGVDAVEPALGAGLPGLLNDRHGEVVLAVAVDLGGAEQLAVGVIDPDVLRVVNVVGDMHFHAVEFGQFAGEIDVVEQADFGAGERVTRGRNSVASSFSVSMSAAQPLAW